MTEKDLIYTLNNADLVEKINVLGRKQIDEMETEEDVKIMNLCINELAFRIADNNGHLEIERDGEYQLTIIRDDLTPVIPCEACKGIYFHTSTCSIDSTKRRGL